MTRERTVTVGADGGQSTIRLLVEGDPEVRTAPGVSHRIEADDAVVDRIVDLLVPERGRIRRLVAGLSTMPTDSRRGAQMAAAIRAGVGADEVWLTGDDVTSHVAAFSGASGVLVAVGTGVACLSVDAEAAACRSFDGAGYLIGDEGGAFWLGSRAVRAAIAAREDRGPATRLTALVAERFGGLADLGGRIHALPRPVDAVARVAMDLLDAADAGDEVATSIVDAGVSRLVRTVSAAARSAGVGAPIAFDGRLLAQGGSLATRMEAVLADCLPGSRIEHHAGAGLAGAAALAAWSCDLSACPGLSPYRARLVRLGGCR